MYVFLQRMQGCVQIDKNVRVESYDEKYLSQRS